MEGRHIDGLTRRTEHPGEPLPEFAGRLGGESHCQDTRRADLARGHQVGDPRGQDQGLAGAGTGHDQERAVGGEHRLALGRAEP